MSDLSQAAAAFADCFILVTSLFAQESEQAEWVSGEPRDSFAKYVKIV